MRTLSSLAKRAQTGVCSKVEVSISWLKRSSRPAKRLYTAPVWQRLVLLKIALTPRHRKGLVAVQFPNLPVRNQRPLSSNAGTPQRLFQFGAIGGSITVQPLFVQPLGNQDPGIESLGLYQIIVCPQSFCLFLVHWERG